MTNLLHRLQHLLIISLGLGCVVLTWIWSPPASFALLIMEMLLFWWALRRGFFDLPTATPRVFDSEKSAREAKAMVTHLLKALTRVQVTYLRRQFKSPRASRAWLKKALPKGFVKSLDDLHRDLEAARKGADVPSLKLAQRIVARIEELAPVQEALEQAQQQEPNLAAAQPMIFVSTENLEALEGSEPEIWTMAGWDPTEATLLPAVDMVAFFSDLDAGKKIRGQTDFRQMLRAMRSIRLLREDGIIYAASPLEDPGRPGVPIDDLPMGFTVDAG